MFIQMYPSLAQTYIDWLVIFTVVKQSLFHTFWFHWQERSLGLHGWIVEIFNVLVRIKIRTRLLPPPPLPNIVRIVMYIDIYGRSLTLQTQAPFQNARRNFVRGEVMHAYDPSFVLRKIYNV